MSKSGSANCFYQKIAANDSSKVICSRLLEIAEVKDPTWGKVGLDACAVCQGAVQQQDAFYNDVLASLLYQLGRRVVAQDGIPECSVERAQSLITYAEGGLRIYKRPQVQYLRHRNGLEKNSFLKSEYTCDVILNLTECQDHLEAIIASILNQQDCRVTLHLVISAEVQSNFLNEIESLPQVQRHNVSASLSDFEALHLVITKCRSEFIAIQSANTISDLSRIAFAVSELIKKNAEIFGSNVSVSGERLEATAPQHEFERKVPVESLVFRRTTYLDYQLSQAAKLDDIEFVYNCFSDRRKIILAKDCTVAFIRGQNLHEKKSSRLGVVSNDSHKSHRLNEERVACDVVLPFRDHLEFVEEAIESIISQENCEVVLHLVDDDSQGSTEEFFRRWKSYTNIRCYRNVKNLGQYTSFNNMMPYLETDFVAIQDGDDVSLPRRISTAVNRLLIADADIFTGAAQIFGGTHERFATNEDGTAMIRPVAQNFIRTPKIPNDKRIHFAMNCTTVMRTSKFRELGGFTDYGSSKRNRAGLDTEFYLRAFYSGHTRFFISQQLVTKYRRHEASATQADATGFGSQIRILNREELTRRRPRFRAPDFDAREFGAIGRYQEMTKKVES